jgi:non-specific serine/threonine protein kinase
MGEGLHWMERVLVERDTLPALVRAKALYVEALLSFLRGEQGRADSAAAESVAAARTADDPETLAYALGMHGLATLSRGDLDTAEAVMPEALRLFREQGDPHSVSSGLYSLANLALARGDADEAMRLLGEGETLSREAGNWAMLANCLGTQAISTRLDGDHVRTAELLRESVEIAGMLRDDYNVVFCATGLAGVAAREGRAERAARLFGIADALSEKTGAGISWSVLRRLNERDLTSAREMLNPEESRRPGRREGRCLWSGPSSTPSRTKKPRPHKQRAVARSYRGRSRSLEPHKASTHPCHRRMRAPIPLPTPSHMLQSPQSRLEGRCRRGTEL